VVGVNRFVDDTQRDVPALEVDPSLETEQVERVRAWRSGRDQSAIDAHLDKIRAAASGTGNLLHPMRDALRDGATVGEVSGALADVFGRYRPAT
jgi:methylmalonyl-CoA mutase N-terminal domain/subunit